MLCLGQALWFVYTAWVVSLDVSCTNATRCMMLAGSWCSHDVQCCMSQDPRQRVMYFVNQHYKHLRHPPNLLFWFELKYANHQKVSNLIVQYVWHFQQDNDKHVYLHDSPWYRLMLVRPTLSLCTSFFPLRHSVMSQFGCSAKKIHSRDEERCPSRPPQIHAIHTTRRFFSWRAFSLFLIAYSIILYH